MRVFTRNLLLSSAILMTSSALAQDEQEQPPAALVETETVNSEMIADKIGS